MNEFGSLDAQNETSAFAKLTSMEHEEFQNYLDERNAQLDREHSIAPVSTFKQILNFFVGK